MAGDAARADPGGGRGPGAGRPADATVRGGRASGLWTPLARLPEPAWLAALVGVAAAVRALVWSRTAALHDDGPIFLRLAAAAADARWSDLLAHPQHPLYPLVVALATPLCGDPERAGAAVSVLSGALAVGAGTLLLRDLFGREVGWVGGVLLALHPTAVAQSADVQSEGLYLALFLGALAVLWRSLQRPSAPALLGAGALSGAAYWVRPEGLGVVLLGAALHVGRAALGRAPLRRALAAAALLGLGAAVVAGPYVGALRAETGRWQLTSKKSVSGMATLEATDPRRAPSARSPLAPAPVLPRASDEPPPRSGAGRWIHALGELYTAAAPAFRFELLPFLALGIFACRGRPGGRAAFVAGLAGLYGVVLLALGLTAGYVSRRHALPPLVPAVGYAAVGLWAAADLLAARAPGRLRRARAPLTAVLVAAALLLLPADLRPRRAERLAERRAAEWLRARPELAGPVAAGRLRVAYYAGERFVPLPSAPERGMVAYLRGRGARYVIVDEAEVDDHRGLGEALSGPLRLLHREQAGGRSAAIYVVPRD